MQEKIKGISLDKLEALIVDFTQEQGATTIRGARATTARGVISSTAVSVTLLRQLCTLAEIF